MHIIFTEAEFEAIRPYKSSKWPKDKYPISYPCIAVCYTGGGGLMGEYEGVAFAYPPTGSDITTFAAGFKASTEMHRKFDI